MQKSLAVGIDIGTTGARAVVLDPSFAIVSRGAAKLDEFGVDRRDPRNWWLAVQAALYQALSTIDKSRIGAVCVDGTSGTLLPVDASGVPIAQPLMYDDKIDDPSLLCRLAGHVVEGSAAHGATSGLAKALSLQSLHGVRTILHQADWIAGQFTGQFTTSDETNALKTGYDPVARCWPDWLGDTGLRTELLPRVVSPGTPIATIASRIAEQFGLDREVSVIAGTTDGCASFLATGASKIGDGVTVLGSTLTLKLLSAEPIFCADFGVYSHRINDLWLAGGASNTGGKVLAHFFEEDVLSKLSDEIDPDTDTGLDFYPLLEAGERFPVMDAAWPPRLVPRPQSDADFLKAMLEGITRIEDSGYSLLAKLGAPKVQSVRTVGGGAKNPTWTTIRKRRLGVPFLPAYSEDAAAGSARLALLGLQSKAGN